MKRATLFYLALLSLFPVFLPAEETPTPSPQTSGASAPASPPAEGEPSVDLDGLYNTGKQLFDNFASDEVKEEYEFPDKAQWDTFFKHLQGTLDNSSVEGLASLEPEVRHALAGLQAAPEYADYVAWLDERLDLIEAAKEVEKQAAVTPVPSDKPLGPIAPAPKSTIPYLEVWKGRLKDRPRPVAADRLMPALKQAFEDEGIPSALAWVAEVESSFNANAQSPAGARGLYQLMPATARSVGLSTFPFDERTHPEKSARAAAKLLHDLHTRFGSWPLALAAYNAGQGRVSGLLKATKGGSSFADIASKLPSETRMYVPKVLATVSLREGVDLSGAPAKMAFAF